MIRLWQGWVRLWITAEAPQSLAVIRIVLGLIVMVDFALMFFGGAIDPLYVPTTDGGLAPKSGASWLALVGGPSAAVSHGLAVTAMGSAGLLCVGN